MPKVTLLLQIDPFQIIKASANCHLVNASIHLFSNLRHTQLLKLICCKSTGIALCTVKMRRDKGTNVRKGKREYKLKFC